MFPRYKVNSASGKVIPGSNSSTLLTIICPVFPSTPPPLEGTIPETLVVMICFFSFEILLAEMMVLLLIVNGRLNELAGYLG